MKYTNGLLLLALMLTLFQCQYDHSSKDPIEKEGITKPDHGFFLSRSYPGTDIPTKSFELTSHISRNSETPWENIGPVNLGGRVTDIEMHPYIDSIVYVGSASGGIFRSGNTGKSWKPIFDDNPSLSIGDLAISKSNPETIVVGTGEANGTSGSAAFAGNGVYKSRDGGQTWKHMGLAETKHIGRIAINPLNDREIFVAAAGSMYTQDEHRGIYKSRDGGETWKKVLFISNRTSAIDIVIHPKKPKTVYAIMWDRIRNAQTKDYNGENSGIYVSKDGGDTWNKMKGGLPSSGQYGRIAFNQSQSDPSILYAVFTKGSKSNRLAEFYKSINGGETWKGIDTAPISNLYEDFGWYFGQLTIHPTRPSEIYVHGVLMGTSKNGGLTWSFLDSDIHVDQHALHFHDFNNALVFLGNDGGVYKSENEGRNWEKLENLPISQFYHLHLYEDNNEKVLYGGTQDNGHAALDLSDDHNKWRQIFDGDGFRTLRHPSDPDYIYITQQFGNILRSNDGGRSFQYKLKGISNNDRTNWDCPIIQNPLKPSSLYFGTNKLYRSTNRGELWTAISDDLTSEKSGAEKHFSTLSAIAMSAADTTTIYTGSDDGKVMRSQDSGNSWSNVSTSLPNLSVSDISVDPNDQEHVIISFSGYSFGDDNTHIFESFNAGKDWINISNGLPNIPVNKVLQLSSSTLKIAGTDQGVYVRKDNEWELLGSSMPAVIITDLAVNVDEDKLYASSYGRSIMAIDLKLALPTERDDAFSKSINVYPNPTSDFVTVSLNTDNSVEAQYYVYSHSGKVLYSLKWNTQIGENTLRIQTADWTSGLYFIKTKIGSKVDVKRLLITH